MGENILNTYIWQWPYIQNISRRLKTQEVEDKQTNIKWAKDLNRHYTKKKKWMANRHIKRYSTLWSLEKRTLKPQWDVIIHLFQIILSLKFPIQETYIPTRSCTKFFHKCSLIWFSQKLMNQTTNYCPCSFRDSVD